ncbi:hypothetical protein [Collinsella aerofaciens]|uniref:hypothetical protein n=1 Tax=Collinsella aerofaciens TaxID=74426 RepID=UPI00359C5F45
MGRQEILFNPVMEEVNGVNKMVMPYVKDAERTANPYQFDLDQNGVPLFTDKNINFVNGMVENDSNYNKTDRDELCEIFEGMFVGNEHVRIAHIGRAVYEIDNENSTHLTAVGRHKVADLMKRLNLEPLDVTEMPDDGEEKKTTDDGKKKKTITGGALFTAQIIGGIENLKERLSVGDDQLVTDISKASKTYLNEAHVADINKINFSFATKFCHWTCQYLGLGDKYCIYDKVVASVFPYFVDSYANGGLASLDCCRIKKIRGGQEFVSTIENYKKDDDGYTKYRNLYDAVLEGINTWRSQNDQNGEIGYREVDRLIWYYFKGASGKRIKQALASIDY